ncbi:MAG: HAD family phosphatase [Pseudomonadota bacterium]
MPIEKPTIVLFDMDGTTVRHVNPAFLGVLEFLDNIIYKIGSLFSKRKDIIDLSDKPAAPRGLLVHRMLHKIRRKPVDAIVQPCPGIYLLLNLFHENNIPIGVVSNSLGKGYGHDVLKTFSLAPYYQAMIFREDISHSKPHPDPILRALKAIKEDPTTNDIIWYIGDRHKDITATIEANKLMDCKIVPFAYGINSAMAILEKNIGTDHIIMSYPEFYLRIKDLFHDRIQESKPLDFDTEKAAE